DGKTCGSPLARSRVVRHEDEAAFALFVRSAAAGGVHIVCAAGPEGVAAAALFAKAFKRARIKHAGTTVLGIGARVDSPAARTWLADAAALLLVGLRVRRRVGDMPHLWIDAEDGEPLAARAFRLAESLAILGDASWCAALGLVGRVEPHALVDRALARHA